MKTKVFLTMVLTVLIGASPLKADLVFDSGSNTFDDSDPYYEEVWVINDAHLDVLGGAMWKLELMHYATANIYDGDIEWLFTQGNSVVNIHAAGDTLEMFAGGNDSVVYLYAYDVTYHPTGGLADVGWIEGTYISDDLPFAFSFYNDASYSHVNIIPEPSTLLLFGLGFVALRRRS
jgi:hypothetical protein